MEKSKVVKRDFYSSILEKEMSMQVYLPANYNNLDKLPVLFFLHGRNGDENILFEAGLNTIADKLLEQREINPMIIVCPRIEHSKGINSSELPQIVPNSYKPYRPIYLGRYEDYFINEVIPLVNQTYNTMEDKKGRFIGGASAGGFAALHYAFRHPELFSKVGGHMPAIELELQEDDKPFYSNPENWNKYDPLYLAKNTEISPDLMVYLDAGENDEGNFFEGCSILYGLLKEKGIDVQNHVFPGNHSVEYIKGNMEKYLRFYVGSFTYVFT